MAQTAQLEPSPQAEAVTQSGSDLLERAIGAERVAGLNQGATDNARHGSSNSTVEDRTIAENRGFA